MIYDYFYTILQIPREAQFCGEVQQVFMSSFCQFSLQIFVRNLHDVGENNFSYFNGFSITKLLLWIWVLDSSSS